MAKLLLIRFPVPLLEKLFRGRMSPGNDFFSLLAGRVELDDSDLVGVDLDRRAEYAWPLKMGLVIADDRRGDNLLEEAEWWKKLAESKCRPGDLRQQLRGSHGQVGEDPYSKRRPARPQAIGAVEDLDRKVRQNAAVDQREAVATLAVCEVVLFDLDMYFCV
jgi:hypothetical protein